MVSKPKVVYVQAEQRWGLYRVYAYDLAYGDRWWLPHMYKIKRHLASFEDYNDAVAYGKEKARSWEVSFEVA